MARAPAADPRLEERGELDRALEFLPSDAEIESGPTRAGPHVTGVRGPRGLRQARLKQDCSRARSPTTRGSADARQYFPTRSWSGTATRPAPAAPRDRDVARQRDGQPGRDHVRLPRQEETGATAEQVARAYVVARDLRSADFVPKWRHWTTGADSRADALYLEFRRLSTGRCAGSCSRGRRHGHGAEIERSPRSCASSGPGARAAARRREQAARAAGRGAARRACRRSWRCGRGAAGRVLAARRHRDRRRHRPRPPRWRRCTSCSPSATAWTRCSADQPAAAGGPVGGPGPGALRFDLYAALESLTRAVLEVGAPAGRPTRGPAEAWEGANRRLAVAGRRVTRSSSCSRPASRRCRWRCAGCERSSAVSAAGWAPTRRPRGTDGADRARDLRFGGGRPSTTSCATDRPRARRVEWLHLLVGDWQLLADLSFADLVLWVPGGTDGWLAVAHCGRAPGRWCSSRTSWAARRAGRAASLLDQASLDRRICGKRDPTSATTCRSARRPSPSCAAGRAFAVITRHTNLPAVRTPSRLELTYRARRRARADDRGGRVPGAGAPTGRGAARRASGTG